jgi:alginate O-acetyltransferase complex protein AlgI
MVFNSFQFFLIFLPAVVVMNWMLCARGQIIARKWLLLIASLFFYSASSVETLPILLGSLVMNWYIAGRLQGTEVGSARQHWLILGITLNVALLVLFKYSHFIADNIGGLVRWHLSLPAFVLPLGISFFTIQQIMYLVDCSEEMISPAPLLEHATFISFFPYITAGPIVRGGNFLPQLDSGEHTSERQLATGLMIFIIGLFKKVVLADQSFGRFADEGFSAATSLGLVEGWLTGASYTFQLYFDFSGYSDMALGVGLMLGLILPENFNSPYKALSIIDFWKRWHITLSNFITTYLYTPMARSIRPFTFGKAMLVTILAMAIAGIWHGAAWTFLIFGLLHGLAIVINHYWRKTKVKLPWPLAWSLTFLTVIVGFVVFRADDWSQAYAVLSSMLGRNGIEYHGVFEQGGLRYLILLVGAAVALGAPNSNELARNFTPSWRWRVFSCASLLLSMLMLSTGGTSGAIYRGF